MKSPTAKAMYRFHKTKKTVSFHANGSTIVLAVVALASLTLLAVWDTFRSSPNKFNPSTTLTVSVPAPMVEVPHSENEMKRMIAELAAAINPSNSENSYMPTLMKEKIAWALQENKAGRLDITVSETGPRGEKGETFFFSRPNGKNLALVIVMPPLARQGLLDWRAGKPFSRALKNHFATGLAHEVLHLENGPTQFFGQHSYDDQVSEEMRVWAIWITQMVRPLISQGEPLLDPQLAQVNDLLRRNKDDWEHCLDFKRFIMAKIPLPKKS